MKRTIDFLAALIGIIVLSPLCVLIAVWIKFDSSGPVLFRQTRIGRNFRPFTIYKFRSMAVDAPTKGGPITCGSDQRITPSGRVLRKTKLDEVPQLLNILRGDMSFVGPRPEIPLYVEKFRADYRDILTVRPGITDLASLKYRNEQQVLGQYDDPEAAYVATILPDKIQLAKEYIAKSSLSFDLAIVLKTVAGVAGGVFGGHPDRTRASAASDIS